jgi:hypothetical protein
LVPPQEALQSKLNPADTSPESLNAGLRKAISMVNAFLLLPRTEDAGKFERLKANVRLALVTHVRMLPGSMVLMHRSMLLAPWSLGLGLNTGFQLQRLGLLAVCLGLMCTFPDAV